jgi:hypothetical protein
MSLHCVTDPLRVGIVRSSGSANKRNMGELPRGCDKTDASACNDPVARQTDLPISEFLNWDLA